MATPLYAEGAGGHPRVPAWTAAAGAALADAASRVRIIAVTTPLNLRAELDRLAPTARH